MPLSPTLRRLRDLLSLRAFGIYAALVLCIGFGTYVRNYTRPAHLYWDENYHIASAQKYLAGVFFMEPHPPLGKMLIALGERLLSPNDGLDTSHFLASDHIKTIPKGYSFVGVRLFPVVCAWLGGLALYALLYGLVRNPHTAFLFSLPYLFDNALIVHFRGAMLDGIQLLFVLLSLLYGVVLLDRAPPRRPRHYLALGALCGLALAVKVNSAIVLLVFPYLALQDAAAIHTASRRFPALLGALASRATAACAGLLAVFLLPWYLHFALADEVKFQRFYGASEEYKDILARGESSDLRHLPVMLRDSYKFFTDYQRKVPELDVCKAEENGSYALTWPFGKKSINYRWERTRDGRVRYLMLQNNFPGWLIGASAVLLALIFVGGKLCFGLAPRSMRLFRFIALFLALYLGYMATMAAVSRVMYLYHYFIPLTFSFVLACLLFHERFDREASQNDPWIGWGLVLCSLAVIGGFFYFSPFTYYQPLAAPEVTSRAWLRLWELKPVY